MQMLQLKTASGMSAAPFFDAQQERVKITSVLLRSAAQLIRGHSELEIVRGIGCALADASPHIRLAWTWFGPADASTIRPQVCAGAAADYGYSLELNRSLLTQHGPAFSTLEGKSPRAYSVSEFSLHHTWRVAARKHQIRQVLTLPLTSHLNGYSGIFVLYADRRGYFDEVGFDLFSDVAELFSSLMAVSADRAQLQNTAYHDALTGLLNRHAVDVVNSRMYRNSLFEPTSTLLMLDVDRFKHINDRFGHDAGDKALQVITEELRKQLRRGDEVIRWGGEEFLVCLPQTPLQDGIQVAEKLRLAVQNLAFTTPLSISVGVAEMPVMQHLSQASSLADQALRQAKLQGRNQVHALQ